jgi:DNA-binding MarR family transcriptional regulator
MRKSIEQRIERVIAGAREFTFGTVLFHHAAAALLSVNVTDMECLALIVYRGVVSPSQIARHTGLSSGAATAMLDRLERSRLIERRPNRRDRRGLEIVLTDYGKKRLDSLFGPLRLSAKRLLSKYDADELDSLADFFDKIAIVWTKEREKLNPK